MNLIHDRSRNIAPAGPDFAAIKQKQQATWASGDFAVIGTTLQIVGESLAEAADVRAGDRVLDVAAGNGNATLAAARRFAQVISTDYVPALLDKGAERAKAEGLDGRVSRRRRRGVAVRRPQFRRRAVDLRRDVHPGSHPAGARDAARRPFGRPHRPGQLDAGGFHRPAVQGDRRLPAAAGRPEVARPLGHRAAHRRNVRAAGADIRTVRRHFNFRYRSAAHWVQVFRDYYGPTHKAFAALDGTQQQSLESDIVALLGRLNIGGRHSLIVPGEYLEVVITKR